MKYIRKNQGVCSRSTEVELSEDGIVQSVQVIGGCDGNLKGICQLLRGMKAEDAIQRMQGVRCGHKATSCPDQIALALEAALASK